MGKSLAELKALLVAKQGYTIAAEDDDFKDLTTLVNDMVQVRNSPTHGCPSNQGTVCTGHSLVPYAGKLSLADIEGILASIKPQTCGSHQGMGCDCDSRTGCSCNGYTSACDCDTRTYSCSCNNNTWACSCNSRTASCSCNGYTASCDCNTRTNTCQCVSRTAEASCISNSCTCYARSPGCQVYSPNCPSRTSVPACMCNTVEQCYCQSRLSSCGTRDYADTSGSYNCGSRNESDYICGSRTSSCGTVIAACSCDNYCTCNTQKRFE